MVFITIPLILLVLSPQKTKKESWSLIRYNTGPARTFYKVASLNLWVLADKKGIGQGACADRASIGICPPYLKAVLARSKAYRDQEHQFAFGKDRDGPYLGGGVVCFIDKENTFLGIVGIKL